MLLYASHPVIVYDRNQDQVSVSVSVPKLLLPKPKLPPYSFPQFFFALQCLILNIS